MNPCPFQGGEVQDTQLASKWFLKRLCQIGEGVRAGFCCWGLKLSEVTAAGSALMCRSPDYWTHVEPPSLSPGLFHLVSIVQHWDSRGRGPPHITGRVIAPT